MKRNIIVFGIFAGLIVTALMIYSTARCYTSGNFESNMVLGYAAMLGAFSFVFVGIKNYRDKYNQGLITFGKAFQIGLGITFIASTMYVIVWLVDYYVFIPDFMDKYTEHVLEETKTGGASALEITKKASEMADYQEMYKNPFLVVLLTYTEILPVGLVISLISALILKRKSTGSNPEISL